MKVGFMHSLIRPEEKLLLAEFQKERIDVVMIDDRKIHFKLGRILSQIRFGSIMNISASLANPTLPRYAVRGVYSEDKVDPVAKIMKEIGYKRAFIVCGHNGENGKYMDELSTLGKNSVCELKEHGVIDCYEFYPENVGLKRGTRLKQRRKAF